MKMETIAVLIGLALLIGFFVAIARLGQIRDELRYQSQLLARTSGVTPLTKSEKVREAEAPEPMGKTWHGIRLDDPAE